MKHRVSLFVLIFFSFVLFPLTSQASEEPPGVKALLDSLERQYKAAGSKRPNYESIEVDSDGGATLYNISWNVNQPDTEGDVKIEKMIISGVSQRQNGSYSFKNIATENIVMTLELDETGPMVVKIPKTYTSNIHILPEQSSDGIDYMAILGAAVYEESTIPLITVTVDGQSFNAKNLTTLWKGDPETGLGKWDISLKSLIIPVSAFPDEKFRQDMKEEFGFEEFDLAADISASITGQNGKLNMAYAFRFKGKQIGDLEFALAGQDIPGELANVLKEMQAGNEPSMGQLMPLVMGIKFNKLKMRFVDDDFTAKALAFAAKIEGTTVDDMTANGAAALRIGLMQLNMPEFSKKVIDAYNTFVKDPKNISVEASPAAPVAIATMMGMMMAPAMAIKTLGVKVEANK